MSRGHGACERFILAELAALPPLDPEGHLTEQPGAGIPIRALGARWGGSCPMSQVSGLSSVRRAVRKLSEEGLLVVTYKTIRPLAWRELRDSRPGPTWDELVAAGRILAGR